MRGANQPMRSRVRRRALQRSCVGILRVSCILAANCGDETGGVSVSACMADPEAAGVACLNYCRAQVDCDTNADLSAC